MLAGGIALAATAMFAGLALLVGATLPVSLVLIAPTDRRLGALEPRDAGPTSNALIARWGRCHALRAALGVAAEALLALATLR